MLFRIGKPNCHATILFNESAEEEAAQNMNAKYTETHAIQNWETPYHGMDIVMRLSFFEGIVIYTYNHIYIICKNYNIYIYIIYKIYNI